jgi:hypothetical protein
MRAEKVTSNQGATDGGMVFLLTYEEISSFAVLLIQNGDTGEMIRSRFY